MRFATLPWIVGERVLLQMTKLEVAHLPLPDTIVTFGLDVLGPDKKS